MKADIYEALCRLTGAEAVRRDEPMKAHTTFRIGGAADLFVRPHTAEEAAKVFTYCRERAIPCFVIGNGSNLLVSDEGYRGVIVQIYKNMNKISREGSCVRAEAGALLSQISSRAAAWELSGMEFAAGIPGTAGGAVAMNAGAYGGEMKDILREVKILRTDGRIEVIPKEDLELGYRTSIIRKKNYVVLEALFALQPGDPIRIRERMEELRQQRSSKQPLEYPSAGSTFKRPEGYFAGKLIMDAGLRGYRVGGAMVSEKHCGFVINVQDATAEDVRTLMRDVQAAVRERFGVELEPEVKLLGEFR